MNDICMMSIVKKATAQLEVDVVQAAKEVEALRALGFYDKANMLECGELLPTLNSDKFLIVNNPTDWRYDYVPDVGFTPRIRLQERLIGSSFWSGEKYNNTYLFSVATNEFIAEVPPQILRKAEQALQKSTSPPNHFRVWFVADQKTMREYAKLPVHVDPALVGYWITLNEQGRPGYRRGLTPNQWTTLKHCAVLGIWGKDLEEIDLAFTRR